MEQLLPKQVGNKNSKLLTTAMLISKLHHNHFMLVCQDIFDEAVLCHLPAVPSRVCGHKVGEKIPRVFQSHKLTFA